MMRKLAMLAAALLPFSLIESLTAAGITPKEVLAGPYMRGPMQVDISSLANAFIGAGLIASGSATLVVSTTLVNSDSVILSGQLGNANVSSGQFKSFEVKTISPGGYFTLGSCDGIALARDTTLFWFLVCPS